MCLGLWIFTGPWQGTAPAQTAKPAAASEATPSVKTANGSAPGQLTAAPAAATASIAVLPAPLPPELVRDIDSNRQGQAILAHLNEVIRFYRTAVTPIQKVGQPSDVSYVQQSQAQATSAGQLAFQSARAQAAFLARVDVSLGTPRQDANTEAGRITTRARDAAKRLADLQLQETALEQKLKVAQRDPSQKTALEAQQADVQGQIKVGRALFTALGKLVASANPQGSGLQGDIDRLQHSVPELVDNNVKPVTATIQGLGTLQDEGVSTQATTLFQLISSQKAIDQQIQEITLLNHQADDLRKPLTQLLNATLAESDALQKDTGTTTTDLADKQKKYDQLADAFTALSDVAIPIGQEILVLEQARANLVSWRSSIDEERSTIVHSLMMRLLAIALALMVIFAISDVWRRLATRYVQDLRRRRQMLVIRRLVTGFLTLIVLTLGFVTQFSSLATFAGFITAGIAVGLQTILLSVAAYFFIVGRFGVKVGDRITVAGVTGDVADVGLFRFYLMELTGTGIELHPTGRIAVFANSVLFQTGTPIYKQIPGTDYAWHELTYKLKPGLDYRPLAQVLQNAVSSVYDTYKAKLEAQHQEVETWMDAALEAPHVESRLQLTNGLEYTVLYPVPISDAAQVDEQIVQTAMTAISRDQNLSNIVDGPPSVHAVIKS